MRIEADTKFEQSSLHLVEGFADELKVVQSASVWIKQKEELETSVIDCVELDVGQFDCKRVQLVGGRVDAEQRKSKQVKALPVWELHVVAEIVVHSLMNVVQQKDVRPRMLQQVHLIVDLFARRVEGGCAKVARVCR